MDTRHTADRTGGSLALLCAGASLAGLGQGMSFRAGLAAVGSAAPQDRRGAVTASFFLVLYVAISIPVIGVGAAAQGLGPVLAGTIFAGLVAVLALVALVSILRANRRPGLIRNGRRARACRPKRPRRRPGAAPGGSCPPTPPRRPR